MLEIVDDTVGLHDFLLIPCGEATFRHFYADKPHRGCFSNLAEALAPFGIEADAIPVAFNLFMNVPVDAQGKPKVVVPTTCPGDYMTIRVGRSAWATSTFLSSPPRSSRSRIV